MELPDDDPEAFAMLVHWVYTEDHHCHLCYYIDQSRDLIDDAIHLRHELQFLKLWILADKFNMTVLAENCLRTHTACLDRAARGPTADSVKLVCEKSAKDSALRMHLVKEVVDRVFLWNERFIRGAGVAAAADASFCQQVMEGIQKHLMLPMGKECDRSFSCHLHHGNLKLQPDQGANGW